MSQSDNDFFRITKFSLCLTLFAGVGFSPTVTQAVDTPMPPAPLSSTSPEVTAEPSESGSENIASQSPSAAETYEETIQATPERTVDYAVETSHTAQEPQIIAYSAPESEQYSQ